MRRQHARIRKNPRRNAHTRGRHGRTHKNGFDQAMTHHLHAEEANDERHQDPERCHGRRSAAHLEQVSGLYFQPHCEKEEDCSDLGKPMRQLVRVNEAKQGRPE